MFNVSRPLPKIPSNSLDYSVLGNCRFLYSGGCNEPLRVLHCLYCEVLVECSMLIYGQFV